MLFETVNSSLLFDEYIPISSTLDWALNIAYNWQTLIAGSFALIGGILLFVQIRIQKREIKLREKQRKTAARLRLPHALSDIHRYLDAMYMVWHVKDLSHRKKLPQESLDSLIENGTVADKKTFRTISEFIILLQAFEARVDDQTPINYYDNMIYNISFLMYLNDSLYSYGRFKIDSVPFVKPSRDQLNDKLFAKMEIFKLPEGDPTLLRIERSFNLIFGISKPDTPFCALIKTGKRYVRSILNAVRGQYV